MRYAAFYRLALSLAFLTSLLALSACSDAQSVATGTAVSLPITPASTPASTPPLPATSPSPTPGAPQSTSTPLPLPEDNPTAESAAIAYTHYNLGEATVLQERFPEDSGFRFMPVRLEGIVGLPEGEGALPVVLIFHGTHPGCPVNDFGVDAWPCTPEEEQANYRGFEYLVRDLAARGYLALAININAENTFGFGEPTAGERLGQLVDLHLAALADAGEGSANDFGVPLDGRVDLSRLVWIGHSRGAEMAAYLIREGDLTTAAGAAAAGYGPVRGLLQLAGAVSIFMPAPLADVSLATVLSGCDGDVSELDGQIFFELARDDRARTNVATSVFLEGASHNAFNTLLRVEQIPEWRNPECAPGLVLDPQAQRDFITAYTADFLELVLGDASTARQAADRLGLNSAASVPETLYGEAAHPLYSPPAAAERLLLRPFSADELEQNLLGGQTTAVGLETVFCPAGFFTEEERPGLGACRRRTMNQPGAPAQLAFSWAAEGASLSLLLPPGAQDVSAYDVLRLRAALDPLAEQNVEGAPLSFSVRLRDEAGNEDTAVISLPWPAGESEFDEFFETDLFNGHVFMREFRLPLSRFANLDLQRLVEISFDFDQQDSGAMFLADIGFVTAEALPGTASTLLQNASGFLNPLRGVARLEGREPCTAVLVDNGGEADAPAYVISSGRCVAEHDANSVLLDQPAAGLSAIFNYFADTQPRQVQVPAARIAYSTMKGRDLAIVELDATTGALAYLGVAPLKLAGAALADHDVVQVVSAPLTGEPDTSYLRHEQCSLEGSVDLLESAWHFYEDYRAGCRDILPGSSGAPVFGAAGDEVAAIVHTAANGHELCAWQTPCEVEAEGLRLRSGASYATPVDGLGNCFAADGRLDLALEGCPLESPPQVTLSGNPAQPVPPAPTHADGTRLPAAWNLALSGEPANYRYKSGPAAVTDCRSVDGYGPATSLLERPLIDDALPTEDGDYVLCLLVSVDETAAVAGQETSLVRAQIDSVPPNVPPRLTMNREGPFLLVEPVPDSSKFHGFQLKAGPVAEMNCAQDEAYFDYRGVALRLPQAESPWTVCIRAVDEAGNVGEPTDHVLK